VPQALNLFSGSILDNLTLNDRTVSFEAVVSAAKVTGLPHTASSQGSRNRSACIGLVRGMPSS